MVELKLGLQVVNHKSSQVEVAVMVLVDIGLKVEEVVGTFLDLQRVEILVIQQHNSSVAITTTMVFRDPFLVLKLNFDIIT